MSEDIAKQQPVEIPADMQKAYELVLHFFNKEAPEVIYPEAAKCFDSLIDMSRETPAVRAFAAVRNIDLKNISAGAGTIISGMHFNPDNNFYITLGLTAKATNEQLHRRWKTLISLYHPDINIGDSDWIEARAKRVNEAYNTLKDSGQRAEHDRILADLYLQRRFPDAPAVNSRYHDSGSGAAISFALGKFRDNRTAIVTAVVFIVSLLALLKAGIFGIHNADGPVQISMPGSRPAPHDKASPAGAPVPGRNPAEIMAETDRADNSMPVAKGPDSEKQTMLSAGAVLRHGTKMPDRGTEDKSLQTDDVTTDEASDLIQKYAHAYTRGDINAFMPLFSHTATENGSLAYADIQKAYRETFTDRINYYNAGNLEIRTDGRAATVHGDYRIDRYIASEDRWVKYAGKVTWRLVREADQVRIISIIYER